MARWRLRNPHYLKVPGTTYEYKELDQFTGKQTKQELPVPLYLDPKDPADCNYPGEIIVCDKPSPEHPKDIHFVGKPTPEMEPLDTEAQRISEAMADEWVHPIESLPAQGTASQIPEKPKATAPKITRRA